MILSVRFTDLYAHHTKLIRYSSSHKYLSRTKWKLRDSKYQLHFWLRDLSAIIGARVHRSQIILFFFYSSVIVADCLIQRHGTGRSFIHELETRCFHRYFIFFFLNFARSNGPGFNIVSLEYIGFFSFIDKRRFRGIRKNANFYRHFHSFDIILLTKTINVKTLRVPTTFSSIVEIKALRRISSRVSRK